VTKLDTQDAVLFLDITRSDTAKFIDELVRLPVDLNGAAIISSASSSFSAVGLLFNGSTF
jgi:hypothetical protein